MHLQEARGGLKDLIKYMLYQKQRIQHQLVGDHGIYQSICRR